jgi:RimJ/RimL family protein N-acetyltransferase
MTEIACSDGADIESLPAAAPSPAAGEGGGRGIRPDERISLLIGETLYLRGLELRDATWASAWRASPFPISAELAEEQLKKDVPEGAGQRRARLIACRRDDGRPVGSAMIDDADATSSWVTLHADPTLGSAGEAMQAEMLGLIVPWLSDERFRPVVTVVTDIDLEPVVRQAAALGMQPAVRLRQGAWRAGRRHDQVIYEYFQAAWVARLGHPGAGITAESEPVTAPTSPAPRRDPDKILPLPENALIGSARLALRPMQVADAPVIANALRAEPDASFGHSRFPLSAVAISDWVGAISKTEPAKDFEVAVVRRASGELIGEVGLYDIDWFSRSAESGSWLYRPEHRGRGYGTEAKHLLLEYAFERLGLTMIWSWVKERNPRSQAALRKQGYRDAGRLHWIGYGPAGFEDARMFDLLADEWRAARDGA